MSVTDKTGLVEFARGLIQTGKWEIISTGGTAKVLIENGIPCILVENVTGFPEMLDGRLKTLHPKVFGGILADRNKTSHLEALKEHDIGLIDLVVVNLYDFAGHPSVEQIDIGGPSLLRAAAKNFHSVTVIVDPGDYGNMLDDIKLSGAPSLEIRQWLAMKVFEATASYDGAIAAHFAKHDRAETLVELGKH